MNARERMITALEHKREPDRVPVFVEGMMDKFRQQSDKLYGEQITDDKVVMIGGDWTWAKFYGFDSQWLHSSPVLMRPLKGIDLGKHVDKSTGQYLDRFGHIGQNGVYQTGFLNTKELWQEWIAAGYFEYKVDNAWIRSWEKNYRELLNRDLVLVPVDVIFEKVREAFSFARFAYFLRKERAFLEDLTRRIFDIGMEFVKGVCDAGFDIITLADDSAYKGRVMFSPQVFEELVVPGYKRLNDYLHKRGLLSFWHSDGYTEPFFPGLIAAGFDGIQSLEPGAGMDLGHLKQTYGDKVCLIGNLDVSDVLSFQSPDVVATTTRKCLQDAMKGGGYILGPSTDIIDTCRPASIKTMVEVVRRDGLYNHP
jgi:hypothetical protein